MNFRYDELMVSVHKQNTHSSANDNYIFSCKAPTATTIAGQHITNTQPTDNKYEQNSKLYHASHYAILNTVWSQDTTKNILIRITYTLEKSWN